MLSWGGVYWNTQLKAMRQLDADENNYGKVTSEFTFYVPLIRDTSFVMVNRLGGGTTLGDAAFFQQMQLGGIENLRGFHTNRFTGKTMIYHNLEVRAKLLDFTSYIVPGTIGIIGFNDIGRVWVPGEHSNQWHHGYGGGIYIVPAELILIQGVVGFSKEGKQPHISIGFKF
jgi:outer membrane protein assembly factor BamA